MKPVLFFDFDDTLVQTAQASREYIRHRYGVVIPDDVYLCGNSLFTIINDFLPLEEKVESDHFYQDWRDNFLTSDEWHEITCPIEGTTEVIPELSLKYDLWIVTARQSASRRVVGNLCQRFFSGHISGMHFVWQGDGKTQMWKEESKRDFISNFAGTKVAFLDDNPGEIRNVQDVIPSYLFDPTGFHHQVVGIRSRVNSWHEIADILL